MNRADVDAKAAELRRSVDTVQRGDSNRLFGPCPALIPHGGGALALQASTPLQGRPECRGS
jgi:hypothetical protein